MKTAVLALFLLLATLGFAQAPLYAHNVVKGSGYQVTLPADVVANISPNNELGHGFGIDLVRPGSEHPWDGTPTRYIGFKSSWEFGELPSLADVVRSMTSDISTLIPPEVLGRGEIRLAGTFPTKLGELPATRLVLEFLNVDKKAAVRQIVVGYRKRSDASPIVYLASLTTTRSDFSQDLRLFASVLSGFKVTSEE